MKHGVTTTVVEIDPAVYAAATLHFGLPAVPEERLFLEDARGWVTRSRTTSASHFDFVIHDCFSGGGVPAHIFTLEFWRDIEAIVAPDGVVAVVSGNNPFRQRADSPRCQNFVGKLATRESRAVFLTLTAAFRRCRAFHDDLETGTEEKLLTEFRNVVSPALDRVAFVLGYHATR